MSIISELFLSVITALPAVVDLRPIFLFSFAEAVHVTGEVDPGSPSEDLDVSPWHRAMTGTWSIAA